MTTTAHRIGGLLLALAASGAGAQEIGRLFTTPAERVQLERWRDGGPPPASNAAPAPGLNLPQGDPPPRPVTAPARAQVIEVNGVVTRSGSARATVWINAVPYRENVRLRGNMALVRGPGPAAVGLTLPSGKRISIKPGQRADPVSGKVREAYQQPAPAARPAD